MKTGKCPKCNSTQVYYKEALIAQEGSNIRINAFNMAALDYYVCTECGYVESYIANPNKLNKIERQWIKIDANV